MTCNDVESIYRIEKRFKSRTSENASKTLNINKLYKHDASLSHRYYFIPFNRIALRLFSV